MLRFEIKQGNILEEKNVMLILERENVPSQYFSRVNETCTKQENLNEYIFSYKKVDRQTVLLAVLNDCGGTEMYYDVIMAHLYQVYRRFGRKISIYLPSVNNFRELAQAVVNFCQKNFSYNYDLKFFCEEDKVQVLEESFQDLNNLFLERKNEVAEFLYSAFNCFYCKNFAYNPCIMECCNIVICNNCSRQKKKCPKCFVGLNTETASRFANLFSNAPYYCPCGEKIQFSQKFEHCKKCDISWFNCRFCNKSLSYANSIEHFREFHVQNLMLEKLF